MDYYSFITNYILQLFRHGDRTVEEVSFYPNDPYLKEQFYPYGVGQLTNVC